MEFRYAKCLNTYFSTEIRSRKDPASPPLDSGPPFRALESQRGNLLLIATGRETTDFPQYFNSKTFLCMNQD